MHLSHLACHVREARGMGVLTVNSHATRRDFAGRRRWVRVLREATLGYPLLRAKLLWRVRQCRRNDERRRDVALFLPGKGLYLACSDAVADDSVYELKKKLDSQAC